MKCAFARSRHAELVSASIAPSRTASAPSAAGVVAPWPGPPILHDGWTLKQAQGDVSRNSPDPRALLSIALGTVLAIGLTGTAIAKSPAFSGYEPTLPVKPSEPLASTGSIFDASAGYGSLYEGLRARRVGDPLTISLVEQTAASKSVSSKSQKGGEASITPPKSGPLSFLKADALNLGGNSSFNGQGNAGQTSTLDAALSVTIAEVRPNGTALVRGEKRMLLSQGDEWIRLSGIIRLADIDQDNTLPSTRVADARIEYSGKGALQRASRQGWLGRFFNMISPF